MGSKRVTVFLSDNSLDYINSRGYSVGAGVNGAIDVAQHLAKTYLPLEILSLEELQALRKIMSVYLADGELKLKLPFDLATLVKDMLTFFGKSEKDTLIIEKLAKLDQIQQFAVWDYINQKD